MTDQKRVAVAGLLACGVGALAVGRRKADRQRQQSRDCQPDDSRDGFVEVPIRG